MAHRVFHWRFGLPVAAVFLLFSRAVLAGDVGTGDPRLVVLIVVDQLRGDLVTRFGRHFEAGGFRLLTDRGALFVNAHYSYGASETAPGHATIATGRLPRQHGIVANRWFVADPENPSPHAVFDSESHPVPGGADSSAPSASARNLIGPGFADQLRLSDRRSRVLSVALKDRAAIFTAGKRPNGAFWLDGRSGRFVTSSYYGENLLPCVEAFNSEKPAERWIGKSWDRALDATAYESCHPASPEWHEYLGMGATFPHRLADVSDGSLKSYLTTLACSPFGNELVLELAQRLIREEKLGGGDAIDMLCIGFSSNDYVGHYFGIDSPEAMDITIRTDRQLARLFKTLDEQVGLSRCVIALTGDHGATTAPALTQALELGGGILDLPAVERAMENALRPHFPSTNDGQPPDRIVLGADVPWIYLNSPALAALSIDERRAVLAKAATVLKGFEGVAEVLTEDDLQGPAPSADEGARYLAWRCYYPGRSGQLYVQLAPYWFKTDDKISGHDAGTTHDRHVPIFVFGPRVRPGRYFEAADPCDISVTLAALIGIEPPLNAVGRVLSEAIDSRPK